MGTPALQIHLRECIAAYKLRTGKPMTYEIISDQADVSVSWLKSIGHEPTRVTTTRYLARLCHILEVPPGDLLSFVMLENDEDAEIEPGEIEDSAPRVPKRAEAEKGDVAAEDDGAGRKRD